MIVGNTARPLAPLAAPAGRQASRRNVRLRPIPLIAALGAFLLAALMLYVGQRSEELSLGYELQAAQRRLAAVQLESGRLELEIARARSLERIEAVARARLGMVRPDSMEFVAIAPAAPASFEPTGASQSWLADAADWLGRVWPWMATADAKSMEK